MSLQNFPDSIQDAVKDAHQFLEFQQARWRGSVSLLGNFQNPQLSIYDCYAHLFLEAFPSLSSHDIQPLSIAGRLLAASVILSDRLIDGGATDIASPLLNVQAMQWEAARLLHQLFPAKSKFWERFHGYLADYTEACRFERLFASGEKDWKEYTEDFALNLVVNKNGMARVIVAGLVEMSGEERLFIPFSESVNAFNVAYQMYDDLCDWKEDVELGIPSILLSRLFKSAPHFTPQTEKDATFKLLARKLYYEGHAQYTLDLAITSLDRAEVLVSEAPETFWRRVIGDLRRRCDALRNDIRRIVEKNIHRTEKRAAFHYMPPPSKTEAQAVAWDALRFVITQRNLGFGEAQHTTRFPQAKGFTGESEFQSGDVFQRALIFDAVCDADAALNGTLQSFIQEETEYVLGQRQNHGVGGWSYHPELPEMPPDADDLAQVIQLFLRSGRREYVERYCEAPLSVLLRDNLLENGAFETWIIPKTDRTPEQERQAKCVGDYWGFGPDTDVTANLLYALELYDATRFHDIVQRGADYIESQQEPDGSWTPRWYYGSYYGVYVCVRLLARIRPQSACINKAIAFLIERQRTDGGWGIGDESDPLSTSLAMLSFSYVSSLAATRNDTRLSCGLRYLRSAQTSDQSWHAVKFIVPEYGSRTMTAAYVLKAALACQSVFANDFAECNLSEMALSV